jgi:hypothetical protein
MNEAEAQPQPPDTLPAECLALVSGLFPRRPPTLADADRAARVVKRVEAAVKRFIRAEEPAPWEAWQRPPGQEDLHRDLLDELDVERWDLTDSVAPVVYGQWIIIVERARQYVRDRWPTYDDPDSLGPANFALAEDELMDVWELVRSLDGIDNVLSDFESYVLTREQVEAVAACYPEFYAQVCAIVREQLAELQTKGKDVSWQKGDILRVLLSIPDAAPLASQATTQQQPAPSPPRAPSGASREAQIREARTPAERVEANETAG